MKITQELIDKYSAGILNPNTSKTYRLSINKFSQYLQENNITDLNQENIQTIIHDYKAYLKQKNYKAATINQHLIILKSFINDYTGITYNKNLKLIKTPKRTPNYLTREQIKTTLRYTDNKTDELIIKLLSNTGLRINEALNLTKQQLTKTDKEENAIITITGKNNKQRTIVINKTLTKQLKQYSQKNKKYIFESERKPGEHISIRSIQYRFKKLAQKIDDAENMKIYSENLKPHNLRHSFAIQALKTNEINYVKEFLGHENISTTQIYTNLKENDVIERFKDINVI